MNCEEIEQARTRAEEAVAQAIREGRSPATADLLLLQYWTREKPLGDRLRDSAFPLLVVAVAMLVMLVMATHHPPVTEARGDLQTTAVDLRILEAQPSDSLILQGAQEVTRFHAFNFATARLGSCSFNVSGQGIRFRGSGLQLPLSGAESLRLETRHTAAVGGRDAEVSILARITTDAVVDAFGLGGAGFTVGSATAICPTTGVLELDPAGAATIELTAPQVAAAAFPEFLKVSSPIPVSRATFGRRSGVSPETCALTAARLALSQTIPVVEVSATTTMELPQGTCLDLPDAEWQVTLTPAAEGIIGVSFSSSAGAVANIDDGLPAEAVMLTYLEVLSADPDLALIFGAIAFILTTVWSAATLLKEILS